MDPGFKKFLLEDAKKWDAKTRMNIARMMKHNPEQLKANIEGGIMDWGTVYCVKSGEPVCSGSNDADELMDAWREFLKDELAAIP